MESETRKQEPPFRGDARQPAMATDGSKGGIEA